MTTEELSAEVAWGKYQDAKIDLNAPIANRYFLQMQKTMQIEAAQILVADPSLRYIAQNYLGSRAIIDTVSMWWLTGFSSSKEALSASAQLYHFDMDRIKFMKFFIYLSDVTSETAPHCYVRGSCRRKPKAMLQDQRYSDEEMAQFFPKSDQVEILAEAGSIFAVDTRGFHKGKPVTNGHRLIMEIEFANSLFGQTYPTVTVANPIESLREAKNQCPETYSLIKLPTQIVEEQNVVSPEENNLQPWKISLDVRPSQVTGN
jgi:hypothetical protein